MFDRHDFLFFDRSAIDEVIKNARCIVPNTPKDYLDELYEHAGIRIPAIVRRQENNTEGYIDIGLSSFRKTDGMRIRVSASLPIDSIKGHVTPFDVMKKAKNESNEDISRIIIDELCHCGKKHDISVGLLGSQALQLVTGFGYVSDSSDFDLITIGKIQRLSDFYKHVKDIERRNEVITDIEARFYFSHDLKLKQNYDIKLKELLSPNLFVMAKSILGVTLIKREDYLLMNN